MNNTCIEPLEQRIAPAQIISSKTIQYTDIDGDVVKLTMTTATGEGLFRGKDDQFANDILFFSSATGVDGNTDTREQLVAIDLREANQAEVDGLNISVKVVPNAVVGADGQANVGVIIAGRKDPNGTHFLPFADLGRVQIQGDLMGVDAGDIYIDPAIKSLDVKSMGAVDAAEPRHTQLQGDPDRFVSHIFGPLGKLRVRGDFESLCTIDALGMEYGDIQKLNIDGSLLGTITFTGTFKSGTVRNIDGGILDGNQIGNLTITESLIGKSGVNSGVIHAKTLGTLSIGNDIVAGTGLSSGLVLIEKSASKIIVGDSINGKSATGTEGASSGQISVGRDIGVLRVGGDIIGGSANGTGAVFANSIASLRVGGDLIGGHGSSTGGIALTGTLKSGLIEGDIVGGSNIIGSSAFRLSYTGFIEANRIGNLTVAGSLTAGANGTSDPNFILTNSGSICAFRDIQKLEIGGNVQGNPAFGTIKAVISAGGNNPLWGTDIAIKSLVIKGDVQFAQILAGYRPSGTPLNSSASIGQVRIDGVFYESDIVAGVTAGADQNFGTSDDRKIFDFPLLGSFIKSVQIGGGVGGNSAIVAGQISNVSIQGVSQPLNAGPANDDLIIVPTTTVHVLEVPEVPQTF